VTARFPALTGSRLRVTITAVRPVLTLEYDCGCDVETPAAIAELGIPDLPAVAPPATLPSRCRTDVLRVDGAPVPLRLSGSTADAVALEPIAIASCTGQGRPPDRLTVALSAGRHDIASGPGSETGLDVDRLVWASRAGGTPNPRLTRSGSVAVGSGGASPAVRVLRSGRANLSVEVAPSRRPSWLVLGQSQNAGWRATIDGRDAGGSTLLDGYANGWLLPAHARALTVELEWVPQRTVQRALALSIVSVMLCLGIVLVSRRRRRMGTVAPVAAQDLWPTLGRADADAAPVGWIGAVVTGLVLAVFAGLVVRPEIGVVVGAATVGVLRWPQWRRWFALLAPTFVVLAGAYIAFRQARRHLPPIFEWPTLFVRARTLGWLAVVVLAADVAVELVTRWRARSDRVRR
jgi:hypothetical protein